jgi:hypothetical protein
MAAFFISEASEEFLDLGRRSFESPFSVFAYRIIRAEETHPFLHLDQQFAYLCVGASFKPLAERGCNPQCPKPFVNISRFRQLPKMLEQLLD